MKKVILALAVTFGASLFTVSATNIVTDNNPTQTEITQPVDLNFEKIEIDALPETVTAQVNELFPGETIEEAFVAETLDGKTYKIILVKDDEKHEEFFEVKN